MARKPKGVTAQITEQIPSVQGDLSALATANAPVIFFDEASNFGHYNGIAHITLEVLRFMKVNGVAVGDRAVVAHLRMNLTALAALKMAIAGIEKQLADQAAAPPPTAH